MFCSHMGRNWSEDSVSVGNVPWNLAGIWIANAKDILFLAIMGYEYIIGDHKLCQPKTCATVSDTNDMYFMWWHSYVFHVPFVFLVLGTEIIWNDFQSQQCLSQCLWPKFPDIRLFGKHAPVILVSCSGEFPVRQERGSRSDGPSGPVWCLWLLSRSLPAILLLSFLTVLWLS